MARKHSDPAIECSGMGGSYDAESGKCTVDLKSGGKPGSIFSGGLLPYFILQICVGVGTTVLSSYYAITILPTNYWATYIISGIVIVISAIMMWYKIGNWKEALVRLTVSIVTITAMSWIVGVIFNWDIAEYVDLESFAGGPLLSVVYGVPVVAVLVFILVDPQQKSAAALIEAGEQ